MNAAEMPLELEQESAAMYALRQGELAERELKNPMLASVRRSWDAADTGRRDAWLRIAGFSTFERAEFVGVEFVELEIFVWFAICGAFMQENYDYFRLCIARGFV